MLTPTEAEQIASHSLYGECGLKYRYLSRYCPHIESLSVWRVWIEMTLNLIVTLEVSVTLCMESVD